MPNLPVPVITNGLLILSNILMTFVWYGDLRFKAAALVVVILIFPGIALYDNILQVPASWIGCRNSWPRSCRPFMR